MGEIGTPKPHKNLQRARLKDELYVEETTPNELYVKKTTPNELRA